MRKHALAGSWRSRYAHHEGFSGLQLCMMLLGLLLLSAACSTPKEPEEKDFSRPLPEGAPALEHVTDPGKLPDFRPAFLDREGALAALEESLIYFAKPSSEQWFPYATNDREITHADQIATLEKLSEILEECDSADEFQGRCLLAFDVYRSVGWDGSGEVLFTAYCEPIFEGKTEPDTVFKYPLYKLPKDVVKAEDGTPLGRRTESGEVVPYFTRAELERSDHLDGLELVYLKNPFEVYIAHVQGSARVNLPSGEQMCVGYAGKTDRPYESVGRHLVKSGRMKDSELSLTRLKKFFKEHPEETVDILGVNESYVFFTEREPGPFGSIGSKVTPYHSLATDKGVFPRGGPCLTVCDLPVDKPGGGVEWRPSTCLCFDQDTGGAIRSAGRSDIFVGTGDRAERLAGYTRNVGELFYFFVKPTQDSKRSRE